MIQGLIRIGIVLIILIALGTTGFFVFTKYRGQDARLRADKAFAEERWREAKMNYTWYIVRHPDELEVLPRYIESCMKLLGNRRAHIRDAGRAYLQLTLNSPDDTTQSQELINFYREYNLWRELDYAADLLLRNNNEDSFLLYNKALAVSHLGRKSQAISIYQQMLELDEVQPEVYGNLALLLYQQGLEEQGWQTLEKALAEQPNNPLIRLERARYLLATNDLARASQEIDFALNSDLQSGDLFLTASKVHSAQNEWAIALDYSEKAVREIPRSAKAHLQIVSCFMSD
ncbi:MAG: hypothetical protein JKY53_13430, partial [Flavobacteriales bacterium]|nr:hypothetical protein [Flavobacteriales bacterium]